MTKKAIFIGPAYPYRGGIAAFNENLATTFQANGWNCKMITLANSIQIFYFLVKTNWQQKIHLLT